MVWPCYSFVDGLSKKRINVYIEEKKLINHDCLSISMLLYTMLYIMLRIMLAYLMLFATLYNAVCLYNAFFSFCAIDFCKCFLFSCFVLVYRHMVCLFHVLICIMHSAFSLLVFPNSMFTLYFFIYIYLLMKGPCAL